MSRAAVANAWLEGYEPPSARATEMARLYAEQGLSLKEIGKRYSLSSERVRQLLKPFGIKSQAVSRKKEAREAELRATHARIVAGETTTAIESERLGYAKPDYLRAAFWLLGLHLQKPAAERDAEQRRKEARDRYDRRVERGPKKHGTASSYKNFGCRCTRCKKANRLYERDRKRRLRAAKEASE